MPGQTQNYGLAFFDFGDDLSSPLNSQLEVDRFTIIDQQLFGLYSVFGNGVVSGWEVSDAANLYLEISSGVGILQYMACDTGFPTTIGPLPPNVTVYVYVSPDATTAEQENVNFYFTTSDAVLSDSSLLLLAKVTTGGTGVQLIDNTVRTSISFIDIIANEIAIHRHDGVGAPKINLGTEVQGTLAMDHIDAFDASKVTTGQLPTSVLPTIDHGSLLNIGVFSHAQLDTLTQFIQQTNLGLIGEVATSNLIKAIIQMKYINADVDKYFINELAVIPGVSPSEVIDWVNTTAAVDTINHCISGVPAIADDQTGQLLDYGQLGVITISWQTNADFDSATVLTNLAVNDGVYLAASTTNQLIVDNFELNGIPGASDANYVATQNQTLTTTVQYNTSAYDGFLGGLFTAGSTRYATFTRTYPVTQNWTAYDTLLVHVKNVGATHDAVYIALLDVNNKDLAVFQILAANEVTTLDNILTNGYAEKSFSISAVTRNAIAGYVIYTDTLQQPSESFYVDGIYVRAENILLPQGDLRLRYNTSAPVVFSSVEYDLSSLPAGTNIFVRVRTANSLDGLANAQFGTLLNSGENFALNGSYIEIDITFLSDPTQTLTPVLSAVYLTMLVPATESGLTISSASEWSDGSLLSNISVDPTGLITLKNENVGDMYFANNSIINELDPNLIPVVGVNGGDLPVTPSQGYNAITQQQQFLGFSSPKSCLRLQTGNYLVCDTGNNRVVEVTEDGLFVRGFISHNTAFNTTAIALCANYNPRLGTLFIAYSTSVDITVFDLSTITVGFGGSQIALDNTVDTVRTLTGTILNRNVVNGSGGVAVPGNTDDTELVLCVILSADKQKLLSNLSGSMYVKVLNGTNVSPIACFYGDYMYFGVDGLSSPIHAITANNGNDWLVCNSRLTHAQANATLANSNTCISILQFSLQIGQPLQGVVGQYIGVTFSSNALDFSDIMLGSAYDLGNGNLLIAGILKPPLAAAATGELAADAAASESALELAATTDALKMALYKGQVIVLNKTTGFVSFRYESPDGLWPSDAVIDANGYYAVAESSITPQNGRIIRLDPFGNIIWISKDGLFTQINDVRLVSNNHLLVST